MRVKVDCATAAAYTEPQKERVTVRVVDEDGPSGWPEIEVAGPAEEVLAWLKRNGYADEDYLVVEP